MIDASPELVEGIVQKIKTNGMFDEMRRDCLADIDTKPAFQNLKQRVENYVNALLSTEVWTPSLNKNQLRAKVRASVMQSGMLNTGIEHILHQVVDAKMYTQFLPKISDFIAENQEDLKKEYLPEVDENQDTEDMDETIQNEEGNSPVPPTPPLPLVQDEEIPEVLNDEKLAEETAGMSGNDLMGMNQDETTEGEAPVIPESAANTLRNLIQSLMGSNITNLLSETKVEEHEAEEKEEEEEEEINSSPHAGTSPSIDPAHIEAFTDESENSDKESENSDHENDTQAGPKTPDEESSVRTPPEKSENVAVSGESEASESICKSDKNDSSFESDPENIARHSDEGSAESNAESEKLEYISSDTSGAGKLESEIESGNNFEEEVAQIIDVNKDFDESIHEVEFIEVEEESIVVEECIVENQEQEEEYEEVVVVDEVREEPDENLNQEVTVTSERRKRHKRHHKRRHRSSSEDSSDDSGQVQSSVESQREVESDEEEVHRSRFTVVLRIN
uniref:Biorientation of chromosomes in cell division protein 1-like 1 n=1 Tax=Phallusia mammillata TaxID=59560 RepID=A0A6F9D888_9ASCI|nr:biorientation of chromosomes in cell division protein 1-like 1 [Phallusia mammillata]